MHTELVGGNPLKGEAYGYVHFKGNKGIIAARNPVIEGAKLTVGLDASYGLDPIAASLVLRRLYPTRWTSPKLSKAGDMVTLPLDGFEMAVYEVFPLSEATEPLLAGAVVDVIGQSGASITFSLHNPAADVKILNPELLLSSSASSKELNKLVVELKKVKASEVVKETKVIAASSANNTVDVHLTVGDDAADGMVAVLLAQDNASQKVAIKVTALLDGQDAKVSTERQEGKSQWYKIPVSSGKHVVSFRVVPSKDSLAWSGKATAWFVSRQKQKSKEIELRLNQAPAERLLPPTIWPAGEIRKNIKLGEAALVAKGSKN